MGDVYSEKGIEREGKVKAQSPPHSGPKVNVTHRPVRLLTLPCVGVSVHPLGCVSVCMLFSLAQYNDTHKHSHTSVVWERVLMGAQ